MELKKFADYKDSGVEWIGEMPSSWEVNRLKTRLKERKEKNSPEQTDFILSLTNTDGVIPYEEKGEKGNKAKEDLSDYMLAYPGDIVLNSMNVVIGSVGLSSYFGAISPVYYALSLRDKDEDIRYYNYVFQSPIMQNELKGLGNGILDIRMRIPMSKLNNVMLPVPSPEEMREISNYLDEKTAEINNLIDLNERYINLLEEYRKSVISEAVTKGIDSSATMKDSGVEWIGNVPSSWNKSRTSEACNRPIGYGIIKLGDYPEDKGVPVFRCSNVREGHLDLTGIREVKKELSDDYKRTILKGGEVLINVRGTLGGCALVPESCAGYNIAREVAMVDVKETISSRFIMYYLLSNGFWDYLNSNLAGSVYQGLNIELLGKACIFLPPTKKEQEDISDYLEENVGYLNQIIQLKREEVELLQECRKSIISEVVTGKFKVPEVG